MRIGGVDSSSMTQIVLPLDRPVRTVEIHYFDEFKALRGLKFISKSGNLIAKVGVFSDQHLIKIVHLAENERITGFRSAG